MTDLDHRWLAALVALPAALLVSSRLPLAANWRRRLRIAAVGLFILALVVVMAEIGRWLAGAGR